MPQTLYMIVEHFKDKNAVPVYRRFRDQGRMAPEGLVYISSWVDHKLERCYQLRDAPGNAHWATNRFEAVAHLRHRQRARHEGGQARPGRQRQGAIHG